MKKSYRLSSQEMDQLLEKLQQKYVIYAPKRIHNGGRYALDDTIMYKKITHFDEIEYRQRSIFPMKEVLTPITQTLFYFTEDEFRESKLKDQRDLLIFGRACDLNAVKIQDQMFLKNGGQADYFYQRLREKAHFVLMECTDQFDGCFCCSMHTNVTDLHDLAVSFREDGAFVEPNGSLFSKDLQAFEPSNYQIGFPTENKLKIDFPQIKNIDEYNQLKNHPMWDEYEKRCIGCGKCTVTCSTCTCFTTSDFCYTNNAQVGERRRTCDSCMFSSFDTVAGGNNFRHSVKDRYRFKIMHKVYAHNARFHNGPMCVGCGRCDADCPQLISYSQTLKNINQALKEIRAKNQEVAQHVTQ